MHNKIFIPAADEIPRLSSSHPERYRNSIILGKSRARLFLPSTPPLSWDEGPVSNQGLEKKNSKLNFSILTLIIFLMHITSGGSDSACQGGREYLLPYHTRLILSKLYVSRRPSINVYTYIHAIELSPKLFAIAWGSGECICRLILL